MVIRIAPNVAPKNDGCQWTKKNLDGLINKLTMLILKDFETLLDGKKRLIGGAASITLAI